VVAAKRRFADEERGLLIDLLCRGGSAGELRVPDALAISMTLLRAYAAFSPPALFSLTRDEIAPALAAMHQLVLGGLLMPPRS
jgi:hypothetical protein